MNSTTNTLPLAEHGLPGVLIAFCGMDGSGKTTLIEALAEHLRSSDREVFTTRQPSHYARESPLFVRYMYEPENRHLVDYRAVICLLSSDRLQQIHETVLPALAAGQVVITDRYVFTAVAQMRARGYVNEDWFFDLLRHVPRPDLTVFCDPGFTTSQTRVGHRTDWRESYIEADHDQRLYLEYRRLMADEGIDVLNTDRPAQESLADIVGRLRAAVPRLAV